MENLVKKNCFQIFLPDHGYLAAFSGRVIVNAQNCSHLLAHSSMEYFKGCSESLVKGLIALFSCNLETYAMHILKALIFFNHGNLAKK